MTDDHDDRTADAMKSDADTTPDTPVKRPRGRPRKIRPEETATAAPAQPTKPAVPRDQPSEWFVPKDGAADDDSNARRAAKVQPADTAYHGGDSISADEIRARKEAARAVMADIGRMKTDARAMDSYIAVPTSETEEAGSAHFDSDSLDQPLSRKEYWNQRREERFRHRQQRPQQGQNGQGEAAAQQGNGYGDQRRMTRRDRQRRLRQVGGEHQQRHGSPSAVHDGMPMPPNNDLPTLKSSDLQALSRQDLMDMAHEHGLSETLAAPDKQSLVFTILRNHAMRGGAVVAEGYLELCQLGHGWLRSKWNSFKASDEDAMVPHQVVRKYGLRAGDLVTAKTRPLSRDRRDRDFAATDVIAVNGEDHSMPHDIEPFDSLVATHPNRRINLETSSGEASMRALDLVAPIGFGQRGLIIAPPRTGKTVLLQKIANAISENHPDAELMVLLIDERPEEITDMQRYTKAQVYASSFDEGAEKHLQVATVAVDMARRSVERGKDVVILLDSLTRLVRAYATVQQSSGKGQPGVVDPDVFIKPKRLFGAARNIEDGGSLTIIATAAADSGSPLDDTVIEEFRGTANMELKLDRLVAEKRIFPAINIAESGTLKEEAMFPEVELERYQRLRHSLEGLQPAAAMEKVLEGIKAHPTNAKLLDSVKG